MPCWKDEEILDILSGLLVRVEVAPDSWDIAVRIATETEVNRKYAFVWNRQRNLKVAFASILWVDASGRNFIFQ